MVGMGGKPIYIKFSHPGREGYQGIGQANQINLPTQQELGCLAVYLSVVGYMHSTPSLLNHYLTKKRFALLQPPNQAIENPFSHIRPRDVFSKAWDLARL